MGGVALSEVTHAHGAHKAVKHLFSLYLSVLGKQQASRLSY